MQLWRLIGEDVEVLVEVVGGRVVVAPVVLELPVLRPVVAGAMVVEARRGGESRFRPAAVVEVLAVDVVFTGRNDGGKGPVGHLGSGRIYGDIGHGGCRNGGNEPHAPPGAVFSCPHLRLWRSI